jgi:hypothetical protein
MSNTINNENKPNPKPRNDITELIAHAMYMEAERPFRYHKIYKPLPIKEVQQRVKQNRGINRLASDLAYYLFNALISGALEMDKPYSTYYFVSKRFIPKAFIDAVSKLIRDINFIYAVNVAARKYKIEINTITKPNKKGRPVTYFIVS